MRVDFADLLVWLVLFVIFYTAQEAEFGLEEFCCWQGCRTEETHIHHQVSWLVVVCEGSESS